MSGQPLMSAISGSYQTIIDGKIFIDSIYMKDGNLFSCAREQLPLRLNYLSSCKFSCLDGKIEIDFDIRNNIMKLSQKKRVYFFTKISNS